MKNIVSAIAKPINKVAEAIHGTRVKHRHITAIVIGTCIGLLGVEIAHMHQTVFPVVFQDFFGYGLHGLGIAPILERVLTVFSLEE